MFSSVQHYPPNCALIGKDTFRANIAGQGLSDIPENRSWTSSFFWEWTSHHEFVEFCFSKPRQLGSHSPKRGQNDTGENFLFQQVLPLSKSHIFTWYGNSSMVTGRPPTILPSRRRRLRVTAPEISADLWAWLKKMSSPLYLVSIAEGGSLFSVS